MALLDEKILEFTREIQESPSSTWSFLILVADFQGQRPRKSSFEFFEEPETASCKNQEDHEIRRGRQCNESQFFLANSSTYYLQASTGTDGRS